MSGELNDGGPAFPVTVNNNGAEPYLAPMDVTLQPGEMAEYRGMTLRDYFAAKALPSAIRFLEDQLGKDDATLDWVCADDEAPTVDMDMAAQKAYGMADAMLKARSA